MVQTLGTRDGLHGEVRTQWHALVNVAGGGERIGALLLRIVPSVRSSVRAGVLTLLDRLLHRWQLQLLVV